MHAHYHLINVAKQGIGTVKFIYTCFCTLAVSNINSKRYCSGYFTFMTQYIILPNNDALFTGFAKNWIFEFYRYSPTFKLIKFFPYIRVTVFWHQYFKPVAAF